MTWGSILVKNACLTNRKIPHGLVRRGRRRDGTLGAAVARVGAVNDGDQGWIGSCTTGNGGGREGVRSSEKGKEEGNLGVHFDCLNMSREKSRELLV